MTIEQAAKILGMNDKGLAECRTDLLLRKSVLIMAKIKEKGIDDEVVADDLIRFMRDVPCNAKSVDQFEAYAKKAMAHGLKRLEAKYL